MEEEVNALNDLMESFNDDEIVQMVKNKYQASFDATQAMRKTYWPMYLNTYLQKHEIEAKGAHRSNIYVPLVVQQIRTTLPYLMQTIFSSNPVFKLEDTTGLQQQEKQALEKLIDIQQNNARLYKRLYTFMLNLCIYGTGIGKVYWSSDKHTEDKKRKVKKPKYIELLGTKIPYSWEEVEESYTEEIVEFDGPVMHPIDPKDFYIDPMADTLDGFWKGHIVYKTFSQLEGANKAAGGKLYKNLDKLKIQLQANEDAEKNEEIANARQESGPEAEQKVRAKQANKINAININTGSTKIRLLEFWTEDDKNIYLVALDFNTLVRAAKNPFGHKKAPFVYGTFMNIPGEFWGMGIPQVIYTLQRNVNSITNQRNDNLVLILNRMWLYKLDSAIEASALVSAPGKAFGCENPSEDIIPLVTPDVTQSAYMEVTANKSEAQEALGTKYISGSNPTGSNRTATGVKLNQNAEAASLMGIFKLLEDTCLKPMVDMFYCLNYQFNTKENIISIMGPQGDVIQASISNEAFKEPRKFYAAGITNILERDTRVHQMTNYLAIVGRDPEATALGLNKAEIYRRIWVEMGLDDVDKIIASPEQQQQNVANIQQMQMSQAMGQQAGAQMGDIATGMAEPPMPDETMGEGNTGGGQQGTRIQ